MMIQFENIKKSYGESIILDNISFEIKRGEFVVLIGPSGCGKTTTLKTINRLIDADEGKIYINEKDITKVDRVSLRRSIGYVIQQIGLFPNMTVEQNISIVPKLLKYSKKKCYEIAENLLSMVDMPYDQYAKKYPSELSGGQQQRIGVLRALAGSPPIVLMDEPFSALDPITRTSLQDEIKRLQKKLSKTIVFVTHDMDEALNLADTIIFMNEGKILQIASPEELLENPADDIIKNFMGKRVKNDENTPLLAMDFMRTNILKVPKNKRMLECLELMSRRGVNTLIVLDDDDTYLGTVSIDRIKNFGKKGVPIGELATDEALVVNINEDARESFDQLISTKGVYVVVLNDDKTVAGIITQASMAKALADRVWGDFS